MWDCNSFYEILTVSGNTTIEGTTSYYLTTVDADNANSVAGIKKNCINNHFRNKTYDFQKVLEKGNMAYSFYSKNYLTENRLI